MSKIIIGIDPDSNKHGVAIYENGELTRCCSWNICRVISFLQRNTHNQILFCIENVCANNAVFRTGRNAKVNMSIARRLGMVQQAQTELERVILDFGHRNCEVKHFKISKMWKKDKAQFEKVTGWTGRSNEDTRSAAYFGYLGLK